MGRLGSYLGVLVLIATGLAACPAGAALADTRAQEPVPSLSSVVERVMPAVVNVSVVMRPGAGDDASTQDELRQLLPSGQDKGAQLTPPVAHRAVTALGSGFIIDPTGFIVTSGHLVAGAERITVILQDNQRRDGRVVGRDDDSDIAVVKIATDVPLPYVRWADSDKAKVGDWVIAIGNPFGLGGTVTAGILSARGRDIEDSAYDNFLQIDAPINRGNSGGPTFNLDGDVLGINTAIFTPSGGSIGIGFAIPSNFANRIVLQLMSRGTAEHGWLGVRTQNVTPNIARSFAIDPQNPTGALVDDVIHDSPAAHAGLRQGDVILEVGPQQVLAPHDLRRIVDDIAIGARVMLTVRRDGKDERIAATVEAAPTPATAAAAAPADGEGSSMPPSANFGLQLVAITPELRKRIELPRSVDGVFVAGVTSGSDAATLGLEAGDVVVAVSRKKVTTPDDVFSRLTEAVASGQVLVLVHRRGESHFLGAIRDHDRLVTLP